MASNVDNVADTLTFRRMALADLDSVVENETRSYQFPWTRGIFADCLRSGHECWVLDQGSELIGHGILSLGAKEAHLLNVCVRRDAQGQGHGRELVRHLLDTARLRDVDVVFLEVRPSNRVACGLYESLGFNEIGRRKDYYPSHDGHEDAKVLALQLNLGSPEHA